MKKFLLIATIILLSAQNSYAKDINVYKYIDKPYIGIPYEQGIQGKSPFILIFANSKNLFNIIKMIPIGEMIYEEFKGKYNFCILNTKIKENKELFEAFGINEKLPVLIVINPHTQTFYQIDKKYYNKKDLKIILEEMYTRISDKK